MSLLVKITPTTELKQIWIENLLNNTDSVTKVSEESVLNGIAFADAKIANKILKQIALVESKSFADVAFGEYLDDIAQRNGISPRFTANGSSTYMRVVGLPGTTYTQGVQTFNGNNGVVFQVDETFTIPASPATAADNIGFGYVKVSSTTNGASTNVDPLSINTVTPVPTGHQYCINEYAAIGGQDSENDENFRKRIVNSLNILSRGTTEMIEQVLMKINPKVLKIKHCGINTLGQTVLSILTVNGGDLTNNEIAEITDKLQRFFNTTEYRPLSKSSYFGIKLQNIDYYPIDLDFRVELNNGVDVDLTRKQIQINLNKFLDYRFWDSQKVDWDDLFAIVKRTKDVKYVPDTNFSPNNDITFSSHQIPRIRSFIMRDLSGNIISDVNGVLNPIYYPNQPDSVFQSTILSNTF